MKETKIILKQATTREDNIEIIELEKLCLEKEEMYLKLEIDFKLSVSEAHKEEPFKNVNEYLYYYGDTLIGYFSISNFGGEAAELTGMVHPEHRRQGIFTRLYTMALEECRRRDFKKILLLCDHKAQSGQEFIKSIGAEYSFSEYEMLCKGNHAAEEGKNIVLRKASNSDAEEIARQNSIYFGDAGRVLVMPEEEEKRNRITYMVELGSKTVGKIRVEFTPGEGFISGVGILPEYRKLGYGREAIKGALHLLNQRGIHNAALEVAAGNNNALNLYKSCCFEEQSVMDYFEVR